MYSKDVLALSQTFMSLTPQQSRSFLIGISKDQCDLIRMSAYNLLLNSSIQLSEADREYFKRHSAPLRKLASRRLCLLDKKAILVKRAPLIRRMFKTVSEYIEEEQKKNQDG